MDRSGLEGAILSELLARSMRMQHQTPVDSSESLTAQPFHAVPMGFDCPYYPSNSQGFLNANTEALGAPTTATENLKIFAEPPRQGQPYNQGNNNNNNITNANHSSLGKNNVDEVNVNADRRRRGRRQAPAPGPPTLLPTSASARNPALVPNQSLTPPPPKQQQFQSLRGEAATAATIIEDLPLKNKLSAPGRSREAGSVPPTVPTAGPQPAAALQAVVKEASPNELDDIRMQLSEVTKLCKEQAQQIDELKLQVKEQAIALQTVPDLRCQVNAIRKDLIDALRQDSCHVGSRTRLEDRRNSKQQGSRRADGTIREKEHSSRGGHSKRAMSPQKGKDAPTQLVSPRTSRSPTDRSFCGPPGLRRTPTTSRQNTDQDSSSTDTESVTTDHSPIGSGSLHEHQKEEAPGPSAQDFFARLRTGEADLCKQTVLAAGSACLNEVDEFAWTALHYAALHGLTEVTAVLLKRSDFVRRGAQDRNGNTALHIAALHDKGDVCGHLLTSDSKLAAVRNGYGETAVDLAKRRAVAGVCSAFTALGWEMSGSITSAGVAAVVGSVAASL